MLPENHRAPVEALKQHHADLAISWDGDYDRCFLFDEHGGFIEGYYIVGLLASVFLARRPAARSCTTPV
jgi:phosphomannomutase/phosphomannomutase/phosphoglucomutase